MVVNRPFAAVTGRRQARPNRFAGDGRRVVPLRSVAMDRTEAAGFVTRVSIAVGLSQWGRLRDAAHAGADVTVGAGPGRAAYAVSADDVLASARGDQ
jgi:hypothetical protein